MSFASRIATWWKAVTRQEQLNAEIEVELAFHIEAYADDLMRSGLPREEAFRRARIELGGVAVQKENIREAWGTRAWDELRSDLRYASRMLAKSTGFTAIAIGSLALGIGANTIIFTVTKAVLLDKLAVPHPEELRLLALTQGDKGIVHGSWGNFDHTPDGKMLSTSFSYPVYQQLRKTNRTLQDIFAFKDYGRLTATIDNKAEAVTSEMVSGNYYQALHVQPILGRAIVEADDQADGSGPVVVISYGFWSRRFGRSPDVIGKKIEINSTPMTIVGVNPPAFTGVYGVQTSPDVFLPFSMQPIAAPKFGASLLADKNLWWVLMMGRLKPGSSTEKARAELDVDLNAAVRSTVTVGKDDEVPQLLLEDGSRGQNEIGNDLANPIYVLISLAGFVLLLACANLANLLLARASSRQREMSVRLALGAGRMRILRQMFTESLLLSVSGGAVGLLLGYLGRNALPHLLS
ncbi:MAG TPA: ABC transporter permease, partial [Alloacidobacterium sp.]|nr:ABC transporter permease [Alloacidobacterium sp.]